MNNNDSLISVVATLLKWRKQLLWTLVATAIGSAAISFAFLKNHYKSTTIFYVAGSDLFKPEQVFNNSQKDIDYYGKEDDVDRVLTIARSGELYDFLIKKFDLYAHYGLDSTTDKGKAKVRQYLGALYSVSKTKNNAIEITVEDIDRQLAANMANAARDKVDEIAKRIIHESQLQLMRAYEVSFEEKEKNIKHLSDSLILLRRNYGVIDPLEQTAAMTKVKVEAEGSYARSKARFESLKKSPYIRPDTLALAEATMKGFELEAAKSSEIVEKYSQGYDKVSILKQMYDFEKNQISRDQQRYLQLQIAYKAPISAVHIIEPATIAYEKSRPKRSIIVLTSVLVMFIFGSLFILLIDNYKDVDWRAVAASQNGTTKRKEYVHQDS
jgi:capsular polysaccharide biosynthesis protein